MNQEVNFANNDQVKAGLKQKYDRWERRILRVHTSKGRCRAVIHVANVCSSWLRPSSQAIDWRLTYPLSYDLMYQMLATLACLRDLKDKMQVSEISFDSDHQFGAMPDAMRPRNDGTVEQTIFSVREDLVDQATFCLDVIAHDAHEIQLQPSLIAAGVIYKVLEDARIEGMTLELFEQVSSLQGMTQYSTLR